MGPFLLGALLAHKDKEIDQAGFDLEREFLQKAKLDLTAASQSDGAGGNAFFTPDFMVRYLAFMSTRKDFEDFHRALPILGRDGTLSKIQVNSPAAGHVQAKTGTYDVYDTLNKNMLITGKGLSGYVQTISGEHLAFTAYVNMVAAPMDDPDAIQRIAGEALGEIAAAARYDHRHDDPDPAMHAHLLHLATVSRFYSDGRSRKSAACRAMIRTAGRKAANRSSRVSPCLKR